MPYTLYTLITPSETVVQRLECLGDIGSQFCHGPGRLGEVAGRSADAPTIQAGLSIMLHFSLPGRVLHDQDGLAVFAVCSWILRMAWSTRRRSSSAVPSVDDHAWKL